MRKLQKCANFSRLAFAAAKVQLFFEMSKFITKIIDFFYHPFEKWMSRQLFRYAACGGGNMVLDWVLYFLIYNFVIGHQLVYIRLTSDSQLSTLPHSAHRDPVYRVPNNAVDGVLAPEICDVHGFPTQRMETVRAVYSDSGGKSGYQLFRFETVCGDFRMVSYAEQNGHHGADRHYKLFGTEILYFPHPFNKTANNKPIKYYNHVTRIMFQSPHGGIRHAVQGI